MAWTGAMLVGFVTEGSHQQQDAYTQTETVIFVYWSTDCCIVVSVFRDGDSAVIFVY